MDKLSSTDIIAIIGCITGVSGLLITFFQFFNERQRLKIVCENDASVYFDKFQTFSHYGCDKQGIARFILINKSRLPITIYKIDVHTNKTRVPIDDKFPTHPQIVINADELGLNQYVIDVSSQLKGPIKLQPFESVYGYFFLSFLPKSSDEIYNLKFKFYTSRRNKRKNILVKPINDKHSNCNNNN